MVSRDDRLDLCVRVAGRKAQDDDEDYEESEEEAYEPGRRRKAAAKAKARYRETDGNCLPFMLVCQRASP